MNSNSENPNSQNQVNVTQPAPLPNQEVPQQGGKQQLVRNGDGYRPRPPERRQPRAQGNTADRKNGASNEDSEQRPVARYRSPQLCCCDLQTGLTSMAIFDTIIGFICIVIFLSGWAGPAPRRESEHVVHREPVYVYHRPYYHRHYLFKRDLSSNTETTSTPSTTTEVPEREDKSYFIYGFIFSLVITIVSVILLIGAIGRKQRLTWIMQVIGWIVFLTAAGIYIYNIFGSQAQRDSAGSLLAICFAILYRIYETVVVYYFVKEPENYNEIYLEGGSVYYGSPPVIYEPVYPYGGYYGGGYYPYGYGYGTGAGLAAGVGLGLALDHGFHDHYYYDDFGHYDYY